MLNGIDEDLLAEEEHTPCSRDWVLYSMRSKVLVLGTLYVVSALVLSFVSGPGIAARLKTDTVAHGWMDRLVILNVVDEDCAVWARINESYRDVRLEMFGWIRGHGWGYIGSAMSRAGGWVQAQRTIDGEPDIFWIVARTSEASSHWKLSPFYLHPRNMFSIGASTHAAVSGNAKRSRTVVNASFPSAPEVMEAMLIYQQWYADPHRQDPLVSFVKMTDLGGGGFSASWECFSGDRFLRYMVVGLTGSGEAVVSEPQNLIQGSLENLSIETPPPANSLGLVEKPLPLIRILNLGLMLVFFPMVFWLWILGRQPFAERSRITRILARRGVKRALHLALLGWFVYSFVVGMVCAAARSVVLCLAPGSILVPLLDLWRLRLLMVLCLVYLDLSTGIPMKLGGLMVRRLMRGIGSIISRLSRGPRQP